MIKKTYLAIVATLALTCSSAFAGDNGFYVGANAGSAGYSSGTTSNTGTAYGITAGYQLNKNWGVEVQYTALGNYSGIVATGVNAGKSFSSTSDAESLVAIGKFPVADTFSLYGKLGVANSNNNQTFTNGTTGTAGHVDATYGLGVQYEVNAAIGVRLGWDRYIASSNVPTSNVTNNRNMDVWALGAVYKF